MTKITKLTEPHAGEEADQRELSLLIRMDSHFERQFGTFLQN